MKFSYQWIASLTGGIALDAEELARRITMKTAECEGIVAFGSYISQTLVVRVEEVTPLAGQTHNRLLMIDTGAQGRRQVVCGAPNVEAGLLAAWVPPGTELNGRLIGMAVIGGAESHGMLASAAELNLGRDASGLLLLEEGIPGERLSERLGINPDWVIEIENKSLTHRPDLWGHRGMAREVAAISSGTLVPLDAAPVNGEGLSPIRVEIQAPELCARFSALAVDHVRVRRSDYRQAFRLQAIGLNAINNIVDITNLLMAEMPQPMHAYDADKLVGDTIFVRKARAGERLRALNGETYELTTDDLVVADGSGPVGLAGVIGGIDTAIGPETKRIVLEAANFDASSVRLTSVRHRLRTDASIRFEKSLDPENTIPALERAFALLQESCEAASASGPVVDSRILQPLPEPIEITADYVSRKLGTAISEEKIRDILESLGFQVAGVSGGSMAVTVPSWRSTKDVKGKADLVEEIGRMVGYGEITPHPPLIAAVPPQPNAMRRYGRGLKHNLAAHGFTEIYSYSFVSEAEGARFGFAPDQMLAVRNPIAEEQSHMRPSLLPCLYRSIRSNVRHSREFRLFEIGYEIHPRTGALPEEAPHLAAAIYQSHSDEQEFFEMKRVVDALFPGARITATAARPYEHPARSASIAWDGVGLGRLFELHPKLLESEGIEGRSVVFDIDLRAGLARASERTLQYHPPRRYPTSGFDLSVLAPEKLPVLEIQEGLKDLAALDLASLEFVGQYEGPPLPTGQKSVTYHLEVGSLERTVTADEVNLVRNRILDGMRRRGFEFRT